MDILGFLAELHGQRDRINQAIAALEALNENTVTPAKTAAKPAAVKSAKNIPVVRLAAEGARKPMSAATKAKLALAAKARWAAKKKPAKTVAGAKQVAPKKVAAKTAKRVVSPEARQRMADAQQKRWAKKKRAVKSAAKKSAKTAATA